MIVEYRIIDGFPGYRVGSDGSVWSRLVRGGGQGKGVHRIGEEWRKIKTNLDPKGRPRVTLNNQGQRKHCRVSVLVLETFVGPRPLGMDCCHNDGNPANNTVHNLRWDTRKANCYDGKKHGTMYIGEKNPRSILKESDIKAIFDMSADGASYQTISKKYGVHKNTIARIITGETWNHLKTAFST